METKAGQELAAIRSAVDKLPKSGRGRRFAPELKERILAYARDRRAAGVSGRALEDSLGVSWTTIRRWQRLDDERKRVRPVPVEVVDSRPAEPPRPRFSLVSPTGWRVEGLSLDDVRALTAGA